MQVRNCLLCYYVCLHVRRTNQLVCKRLIKINIANDSEKLMHQTISAKLFSQTIILHCKSQDCAYFFNQQVRSPLFGRPESANMTEAKRNPGRIRKLLTRPCHMHPRRYTWAMRTEVRLRKLALSQFQMFFAHYLRPFFQMALSVFFSTPTTAVVSFPEIASGLISPVRR